MIVRCMWTIFAVLLPHAAGAMANVGEQPENVPYLSVELNCEDSSLLFRITNKGSRSVFVHKGFLPWNNPSFVSIRVYVGDVLVARTKSNRALRHYREQSVVVIEPGRSISREIPVSLALDRPIAQCGMARLNWVSAISGTKKIYRDASARNSTE